MTTIAPQGPGEVRYFIKVDRMDRATAEMLKLEILCLARAYGAVVEEFLVDRASEIARDSG